MPKFSLALPFFVPLQDGAYTLHLGDHEAKLGTETVHHNSLDVRLGGIEGDVAFERDQMGLLCFTRLDADLSADDLQALVRVLGGGRLATWGVSDVYAQAELALLLFNHFLERYRVATRNPDVRPIGQSDLAIMRVENEGNVAHIRLYGGGTTLPIAGLSPECLDRVERSLAAPYGPSGYELSALQALYALDNGTPNEAILLAAGALELAIDVYLARSWRTSIPAQELRTAANVIGVNYGKGIRTIDDILELGSISKKLKSAPIAKLGNTDYSTDAIEDALEARNAIAHSGVRIASTQARRHVIAITGFVLDQLAPAILREFPRLLRQDFLYAYEEALGRKYLPQLEKVAELYLGNSGLSAKLYNHKAKRENMFSDRYGAVIAMRVAFADFETHQIALFIGRSILHHWMEVQTSVAFARPASSLPDESTRPFWAAVASDLTRAVRGVVIDLKLAELGLAELIAEDVGRQVSELRQKYDWAYIPPKFEQIDFWTSYLALSRVAVMIPSSKRNELLAHCSNVAPEVVAQARRAIPGMEAARLDDPSSILRAMVAAHDAHGSLLGTVPVHDPNTRQDYGLGLRFEDLRDIME